MTIVDDLPRPIGNPIIRWVKGLGTEIAGQILQLANSALGLVAALAWNDAVQAVFKEYFPASSGVVAKFLYAIVLTTFVVTVSINLSRIAQLAKGSRR